MLALPLLCAPLILPTWRASKQDPTLAEHNAAVHWSPPCGKASPLRWACEGWRERAWKNKRHRRHRVRVKTAESEMTQLPFRKPSTDQTSQQPGLTCVYVWDWSHARTGNQMHVFKHSQFSESIILIRSVCSAELVEMLESHRVATELETCTYVITSRRLNGGNQLTGQFKSQTYQRILQKCFICLTMLNAEEVQVELRNIKLRETLQERTTQQPRNAPSWFYTKW